MKILFISQYYLPHVGGVEKHVFEVTRNLKKEGHDVKLLSSDGNGDYNINYPKIKYLGLFIIWWQVFKIRKIIYNFDIIHIHDVFIWYLPLKLLYPNKNVYITFHGWEGKYPIPALSKLQKRTAWFLTDGSISVGNYINKWYGIKSDYVVYGGVDKLENKRTTKTKNSVVFLGRLEKDTGLKKFFKRLSEFKYSNVTFVGDGLLRSECEKYGKVTGFTDPKIYLMKAEYAAPGGYLSYLEALSYGCKIIVYPDNNLKKDYWNEIIKNIPFGTKSNLLPSWQSIANTYLKLWKVL